MQRSIAMALFLAAPLAGCAPLSGASWQAAPPGVSDAHPAAASKPAEPTTVVARIVGRVDGSTIATARGRLEPHRTLVFETSAAEAPCASGACEAPASPGAPSQRASQLKLHVEPRDETSYTVEVAWEETTPSGRFVRWSPSLVVAKDQRAEAEIAWADGDGRRLVLALGEASEREASAATPVAGPVLPSEPTTPSLVSAETASSEVAPGPP